MSAAASIAAFQGAGPMAGIDQASPHQQIELLLGGLLSRLARLRVALRQGQHGAQHETADRALSILAYLRQILDPKPDPALAASLGDLYRYCEARILEGCGQADENAIAEVAGLITEIKQAWDGINPASAAA